MSLPALPVRVRPRASPCVNGGAVESPAGPGPGPSSDPEAAAALSKGFRIWRRLLALALLLFTLAAAPMAAAQVGGGDEPPRAAAEAREGITVEGIRLEPTLDGEGFELSVDFALSPSPRLAEAVNKGVVLYFLAEAELFEPRWYWWDDRISTASLGFRLSYHALTRQYRLTAAGVQQQFTDLDEALRALGRVRAWRVVDAEKIRYGRQYVGQVRMRLDPAHLPKPFQLTAITNKDWTLQAEWKRFEFNP